MILKFLPEPGAEEQRVRETARRFAATHLRPFAIADDKECRFRRDAFNEMAKARLTCLVVPKSCGGEGMSYLSYYGCLEEIGRASAAMAVTAGVTNLIQGGLAQFGTDTQKNTFLKDLVSGKLLGAFSLSEPGSGSDAASLRTAARRVEGGCRLTRTKLLCSTAGNADLYLLLPRTGEHKT